MFSVAEVFSNQVEVKKSKFTSYLVPIDKFDYYKKLLKEQNPKANHIVWASREINELDQIIEGSSDDGEPKGAAGVPTLNCLRGRDLVNVAIFTVRYFGGVKLGVGGMVRAYSKSANSVIDTAKLIPFEKSQEVEINIPYSRQREVEYILKEVDIGNIKREFTQSTTLYKIEVNNTKLNQLKTLLKSYNLLQNLRIV